MGRTLPVAYAGGTMATKREDSDSGHDSDGIGGIVDELASSWLVGDALTRIVDVGERAFRAQQGALSALGLPSGSQFESLNLRVRTIFHRLEELEDELDRLTDRIVALEAEVGRPGTGTKTTGARRSAKR